jgi:hypothetical protein
MIDPNVGELALRFLDGDESALPELANRVETVGCGEAGALRTRKTFTEISGRKFSLSLSDPYELTYHALPEAACWQLACDFADRVLPIWDDYTSKRPEPRQALASRRAWLRGVTKEQDTSTACEEAWVAAANVWKDNGIDVIISRAAANAGRSAAVHGDTRAAVRAAAKYAREARWMFLCSQSEIDSTQEHAERDWQRERLRAYFRGDVPFATHANIEDAGREPDESPRTRNNVPGVKPLHSMLAVRRETTVNLNRPTKDHPDLGELVFINDPPGWWKGTFAIGPYLVHLDLQHGANIPKEFIEGATRYVEWIKANESSIREFIASAINENRFQTGMEPRPTGSVTSFALSKLVPWTLHCFADRAEFHYSAADLDAGNLIGAERVIFGIDSDLKPSSVFLIREEGNRWAYYYRPIPPEAVGYENSLPDQFIARNLCFGDLALDDELRSLLTKAIEDVDRRQQSGSPACAAYMRSVQRFLRRLAKS